MMKCPLLLIALLIWANGTQAQKLSLHTGAGIINNSGPLLADLLQKDVGAGTSLLGDIGLAGTLGNWEIAIGSQVYSMRSSTRFLFERYLIPDGTLHSYRVNMGGPVINPYLSGNYHLPVGKHNNLFAGARGGVLFSTKITPNPLPFFEGLDEQGRMMMPVNSSFAYGLQAGFITHSAKNVSGGVMLMWQQVKSSAHLSYTTYYTVEKNGEESSVYVPIDRVMKYKINMYSVQIFLRFALFNKPETPAETENPENQ